MADIIDPAKGCVPQEGFDVIGFVAVSKALMRMRYNSTDERWERWHTDDTWVPAEAPRWYVLGPTKLELWA